MATKPSPAERTLALLLILMGVFGAFEWWSPNRWWFWAGVITTTAVVITSILATREQRKQLEREQEQH